MIVTAFVPDSGRDFTKATIDQLRKVGIVEKIYLLSTAGAGTTRRDGCETLVVDSLQSSATVKAIAKHTSTPLALLVLNDTPIEFGQFAIERFASVTQSTGSGL